MGIIKPSEIRGQGTKKKPLCPICERPGHLYERRNIKDPKDTALVVRCEAGCVETLPSHDRNQLWEWWSNPKYWNTRTKIKSLYLPGEWGAGARNAKKKSQ